MSDYEKSLEYLRDMKKPGNTIFGVSHGNIPKEFPMKQKDDESKAKFGLKGLAVGGLVGGLTAKAVQETPFGVPSKNASIIRFGVGAGAAMGLARNLLDHGRNKSGKEKNKLSTTKKKK